VVHKKETDAPVAGLHPVPPAQPNMPASSYTPLAPTAPSHSSVIPPVTGDLGVPFQFFNFLPTPLAVVGSEEVIGGVRKWRWQ